jgi:predicted HAD superfamily Cof-like phosphohydrolase
MYELDNVQCDSSNKTPHQKDVEFFMTQAGQQVPSEPTIPDEPTRLLRARLVLEEALELIDALCVELDFMGFTLTKEALVEEDSIEFSLYPDIYPKLEEIAKEAADVIVVTTGTASACGIAMKPIQQAVDQSNLEKFGPGGYRDKHGKWHKPTNWKKPDLTKLLKDQGR